jgi:hypothetical protein
MPALVVPAKSKHARALIRAGFTPFLESDGKLHFDAPPEPLRLEFLRLRRRERGFSRLGIWLLLAAAALMLAAVFTFSASDPPCDSRPCPSPALGAGAWLVVMMALAIVAAIWCFVVGARADREASRLEALESLRQGKDEVNRAIEAEGARRLARRRNARERATPPA